MLFLTILCKEDGNEATPVTLFNICHSKKLRESVLENRKWNTKGGRLLFIGRTGFKWPRIDVNNEVLSRVWGKVHEFSKDVRTNYLQIFGASRMAFSKFHTDGPKLWKPVNLTYFALSARNA